MAQDKLHVLDLKDTAYSGAEPEKNRHIDPVYALLKRGKARPDQEQLAFFTDTSICSGCKACEVACKQWNQLKTTHIHWSGDSYDNTEDLSSENWRHVKFIEQFSAQNEVDKPAPSNLDDLFKEPKLGEWLFLSDQCKHCQVSPCHEACPTGAIMRNEYGGIYYQTDICMGCNMCVAACPFGVPEVSPKTGHSMKCSQCYDRLLDGITPACSLACTTGCIQFGPRDEMVERARKRLADLHAQGHTEANLYGVDAFEHYQPLNSFYLLMDRPSVYGLPEDPVRPVNHMFGDYVRAFFALIICIAAIIVCFNLF